MFEANMLLYAFATLIAVLYLPAIVKPKAFRKQITKFISNADNCRFTGILMMLTSFLYLSTHWELSQDWMMSISIIGWVMLFKGLIYFWFPGYPKTKVKKFISSDEIATMIGILSMLIAAGVTYIGLNLV